MTGDDPETLKAIRIDVEWLRRFERGLRPHAPEKSAIPGKILGYGEISAVLQIGDDQTTVYKRLPLFRDEAAARRYQSRYAEYCAHLQRAGLRLPADGSAVVSNPHGTVVLYIAQQRLPREHLAHVQLARLTASETGVLFEAIVRNIEKIWQFNREHTPVLHLSLDGQLSNWARAENELCYLDTGTPMFRKNGVEQLDPELFLRSVPPLLRGLIRTLFLEEVMNRYYDPRQVYCDLAGNLIKEGRADLIPPLLEIVNPRLPDAPLSEKEVQRYYREDRIIWETFLRLRRLDRWLHRRLGRRYEFVLPGKIRR